MTHLSVTYYMSPLVNITTMITVVRNNKVHLAVDMSTSFCLCLGKGTTYQVIYLLFVLSGLHCVVI